ncbi:hypothetical protein [Furfurilactobacillus milii]|uniref:Uncharacterized protein n=1 Tax=Furfurilactobacillus milii TaxID=2888272 RepID=A0A6N9I3G2_9LACO|nr:hypothetical protein [Furfurilactobacillus milii]MYV17500.1 hypothetical protein [Furfurilactobacillus milii]
MTFIRAAITGKIKNKWLICSTVLVYFAITIFGLFKFSDLLLKTKFLSSVEWIQVSVLLIISFFGLRYECQYSPSKLTEKQLKSFFFLINGFMTAIINSAFVFFTFFSVLNIVNSFKKILILDELRPSAIMILGFYIVWKFSDTYFLWFLSDTSLFKGKKVGYKRIFVSLTLILTIVLMAILGFANDNKWSLFIAFSAVVISFSRENFWLSVKSRVDKIPYDKIEFVDRQRTMFVFLQALEVSITFIICLSEYIVDSSYFLKFSECAFGNSKSFDVLWRGSEVTIVVSFLFFLLLPVFFIIKKNAKKIASFFQTVDKSL